LNEYFIRHISPEFFEDRPCRVSGETRIGKSFVVGRKLAIPGDYAQPVKVRRPLRQRHNTTSRLSKRHTMKNRAPTARTCATGLIRVTTAFVRCPLLVMAKRIRIPLALKVTGSPPIAAGEGWPLGPRGRVFPHLALCCLRSFDADSSTCGDCCWLGVLFIPNVDRPSPRRDMDLRFSPRPVSAFFDLRLSKSKVQFGGLMNRMGSECLRRLWCDPRGRILAVRGYTTIEL